VTSVALGNDRQTGTFVSTSGESVTFKPAALDNPVSLRTADITRLEVSRGTRSHMLKGAVIGFVVVGGTAAAITAVTWSKDNQSIDFGPGGDAALVAVPFGLVGALVGALIGARHTENWVTVPIPGK
jgi:hypothetical protein